MADMLRRGLSESGYAVDVVGNGPDALWRAAEAEYAAIVLDVMLPGIDGFETCRRLRAASCWAPVLILTARTGTEDRVTGLDCGADDYLCKPFSFNELQARLRAVTRRGARPRPTVLTVGTLRLDPAARVAWRGPTELKLSVKEYELLKLFMTRPGDLLSRDTILESVWDFAYNGVSNVVDQYIAFLRRKIDRPFGVEQLQTIRGAGYRLMPQPVRSADVSSA